MCVNVCVFPWGGVEGAPGDHGKIGLVYMADRSTETCCQSGGGG